MKFWLWLIFLGAGTGAAYLIFHDSPPSKTDLKPAVSQITEEKQEDEEPSVAAVGPGELILPEDAGAKPLLKKIRPIEEDDAEEEPDRDRDDPRDDPRNESDERAFLNSLPVNRPARVAKRPKAVTDSSPTPSGLVATSPPPSSPASSSGTTATPGAASGAGGSVSSASLGGTFPALPATASSSGASTQSGSASTPFSSGTSKKGTTPPPTNPAGGPTVPEEAVARKALAAKPPQALSDKTSSDELILPPPESPKSEVLKMEIDPRTNAWRDAMRIPEGFAGGLSLFPRSVAAANPNAFNDPAVPKDNPPATPMILGATWKSGLDSAEKPTIEILVECPETASDCNPHQLPAGSPVVADYLYKDTNQKEDQVPESKTFEIGTVPVTDTQTEAAFHISPGFASGRFVVVLTGKTTKHMEPFEVIPTTTPPAQIESYLRTIPSKLPQSSPPVPK